MFSPLILINVPSWPLRHQVWISNSWPAKSSVLIQWHRAWTSGSPSAHTGRGFPHRGVCAWACTLNSVGTPQTPPWKPVCTPLTVRTALIVRHGNRPLWALVGYSELPGQELSGSCAEGTHSGTFMTLALTVLTLWEGPELGKSEVEPKEYLELRVKLLWKIYILKAAVFAVTPLPPPQTLEVSFLFEFNYFWKPLVNFSSCSPR